MEWTWNRIILQPCQAFRLFLDPILGKKAITSIEEVMRDFFFPLQTKSKFIFGSQNIAQRIDAVELKIAVMVISNFF